MIILSTVGTGPFYLFFTALVYWFGPRNWGIKLGLFWFTGGLLNGILKNIIIDPRPSWISKKILPYENYESFGMPSGHAQSACGWIIIARKWWTLLAIIYLVSVGFSRIYLGGHSISQVIVGWAVGLSFCFVLSFYYAHIYYWWSLMSYKRQLFLVNVTHIFLLGFVIYFGLRPWTVPIDWLVEEHHNLQPSNIPRLLGYLGLSWGFITGILLSSKKKINMSIVSWSQAFICLTLGLGGLAILYLFYFNWSSMPLIGLWSFSGGIWISIGMPYFQKYLSIAILG